MNNIKVTRTLAKNDSWRGDKITENAVSAFLAPRCWRSSKGRRERFPVQNIVFSYGRKWEVRIFFNYWFCRKIEIISQICNILGMLSKFKLRYKRDGQSLIVYYLSFIIAICMKHIFFHLFCHCAPSRAWNGTKWSLLSNFAMIASQGPSTSYLDLIEASRLIE